MQPIAIDDDVLILPQLGCLEKSEVGADLREDSFPQVSQCSLLGVENRLLVRSADGLDGGDNHKFEVVQHLRATGDCRVVEHVEKVLSLRCVGHLIDEPPNLGLLPEGLELCVHGRAGHRQQSTRELVKPRKDILALSAGSATR